MGSINLSQLGARHQCLFSVKTHPMVPAYWINSQKHYIGLKKIGNHLGINYLKIDTHSILFCDIMVEIDMPYCKALKDRLHKEPAS